MQRKGIVGGSIVEIVLWIVAIIVGIAAVVFLVKKVVG
jgi:hypothetical protein